MPGLLWAWKFSKASALVSVVRLLPVAREISALRGVSPRCTHHWVRRVDSTIFQWVSRSFWARFVSSRPSQHRTSLIGHAARFVTMAVNRAARSGNSRVSTIREINGREAKRNVFDQAPKVFQADSTRFLRVCVLLLKQSERRSTHRYRVTPSASKWKSSLNRCVSRQTAA